MTPERWRRIEELFQATVNRPRGEQAAFLSEACGGDEELSREVQALLASDSADDGQVEKIASKIAADWISEEQSRELIGQSFGRYEILSALGSGGMGDVYLARDTTLDRKVALKLLPRQFTQDRDRLRRFEQEARAASALNHPNIVTIHEIGEKDGIHFIAMEYVDGETLRDRMQKAGRQLSETLEIGVQTAGALAAAHDAGIIHRDIKPANIMVRRDGYAKVLDFGLAKLSTASTDPDVTELGRVMGTINYMSPEQALGQPVDHRTDIFSLGAVLYEMATGHRPFEGESDAAIYDGILNKTPAPLTKFDVELSLELDQVIRRALEKDRQSRYQRASDLHADLKLLAQGSSATEAALVAARLQRDARRRRNWRVGALAGLVIVIAGALWIWRQPNKSLAGEFEKSIAVLPFENLSNDREDASFADGVQDDLLTKLAKIADLKVISRNSVMQYRGQHDTHQIGETLRVSHVLEGSVRKTGAWLHVNAQLIDARTDTHVWAEQYDCDLKEMFAIQHEIAEKVAQRLHAKISPAEKLAIERPPTIDLTAFALYSRAKNILISSTFARSPNSDLLEAVDLLNQAVAHDPTFFQAYCQLAWAHDRLYFNRGDRTPARLALAEAAIQAAFRLRPDAGGEAHVASAWNLYLGHQNYDGALAELEKARPSLPNDARLFELKGYIERRRGHWEDSIRNLERALDLDPRNLMVLHQTALTYDDVDRYADEEAILDRVLAIEPNDLETKATRAYVEFDWKADTRPLHQLFDEVRAKNPGALPDIADRWLDCALAERDGVAATDALAALGGSSVGGMTIRLSPHVYQGLVARMTNDDAKARAAFTVARAEQEKLINADPNDAGALTVLGLIDAALGRKEDALREGRRAVELLPLEKDARSGPGMIVYLAKIAAWVGDTDLACQQLARVSRLPNGVSYGNLKLMPWWDPLRGDRRFEKIVADLAPK